MGAGHDHEQGHGHGFGQPPERHDGRDHPHRRGSAAEGAPRDHVHGHGHDHAHDDAHGHAHGRQGGHRHGHGHVHAPQDFGKAFAIGVVLHSGFVVAEFVYGLRSDSLALIADAGHNLSDVLGLLLAWGASIAVRRMPTRRFTYGLRGTSILAALANAALLMLVTGAIAW